MPANKQAALRYQIINRCLRNKFKPYPKKEDLRQACEDALFNSQGESVSMSTIDKDLYAMRNDLTLGYEAPIKYSKEYGGYYYEDPEYSIDKFPLGEEHLEAIRFAAATLEQFKDTPLFDQFESAIGKISDRVNITSGFKNEDIRSLVQFEWAPKAGGGEYLESLYRATREQWIIEFDYESFKRNKSKTYLLQPYLLKEYRNRWYVIGYSEEKSRFVTFALDRFLSLNVTEERFKREHEFDSQKFFKHSFGITAVHEAEVMQVQLSFNQQAGMYVKSQPIHQSQKIIEEDAEHLVIQIEVMDSFELKQAILGLGDQVKVLKPASLKEQIIQGLKKNLENYNKDQ